MTTFAAEHVVGTAAFEGVIDRSLLNGHADMDAAMVAELFDLSSGHEWTYASAVGLRFANEELATNWASKQRSLDDRIALEAHLLERKTIDIPVIRGRSIVIDGEVRPLTIVAATDIESNHGDMTNNFYLRDQVQAAAALMELALQDPDRYGAEGELGRSLLISSLDFMSTPNQQERFDRVIETRQGGQSDWPQILAKFTDLETNNPNGWRNIQDSFQMLTHLTFDALDRGFITTNHLTIANKRFLGAVMPFLAAVGFPKYETSGTWEEVMAVRTSVMAVETAMLHKMMTLRNKGADVSFLVEGFESARHHISEHAFADFDSALSTMLGTGLREIGRRFPFESPDAAYEGNPIKYREADAATLAYLLLYDIPELLAANKIPIGKARTIKMAEELEIMVLKQVESLIDPETNGLVRYHEDSYQGINFHLKSIQVAINALKARVKHEAQLEGREVDLDEKQRQRGRIVPAGRPPAWNLGLGQFASWAAKKSLRAMKQNDLETSAAFDDLSTDFLNRGLTHVTSENQWHMVLGEDENYHVRRVPANRMPECYVTYEFIDGLGRRVRFDVPSPHIPLNWSSAMMRQAIGLQVVYAARREAHTGITTEKMV
jgi:hypothetical protein